MHKAQSSATRAYQAILAAQPMTPGKIAFAWQVAAGPTLGRAGTPHFSDGSLRITARDATWQQEIRRARSLILERLNELLGAGTVRRLVID